MCSASRRTAFLVLFLTSASWHSSATLTEDFPCFILSCKANARVKLAKTGHGRTLPKFLCRFMYCLFCVVLRIVCVCVCVCVCVVCGVCVCVCGACGVCVCVVCVVCVCVVCVFLFFYYTACPITQ